MKHRHIRLATTAALIASGLTVTTPALAHHSGAMFEPELRRELVGTVRQFRWSNPHAWIEIDVPGEDGEPVMWAVEMTAPGNLAREGWRRSTLKAGDEVILTVRPLRDGQPGGTFVSVTTMDGVSLPEGAPPPAISLGGTSAEAAPVEDAGEAETTDAEE